MSTSHSGASSPSSTSIIGRGRSEPWGVPMVVMRHIGISILSFMFFLISSHFNFWQSLPLLFPSCLLLFRVFRSSCDSFSGVVVIDFASLTQSISPLLRFDSPIYLSTPHPLFSRRLPSYPPFFSLAFHVASCYRFP